MLMAVRVMSPAELASAWGIETTTLNVLLGVVLGAILAFIPQTVNWIYDSYQRRQERRVTAKREVLLKAAEGAAYVSDVIVSYYVGRTGWADALKAAPGWMHKVHAVGTDATVKAFMGAHDCAAEAISELELLSYRISEKEREYDSLLTWRENLIKLQDNLKDPKYMDLLPDREEKQFEIMNTIMTSFGRQAKIAEEKKKLQRELMQRSLGWATKYEGYVTNAMLQVRRELTFKGASGNYRDILEASSAKSRLLYARMMAELMKDDDEDAGEPEDVAQPPAPATSK